MATVEAPASVACPLCKSDSLIELVRTGVRESADEKVWGCGRCLHQFLGPPLYDLRDYYRGQYREDHSYVPGQRQSPQDEFDMVRPFVAAQEQFFREFVPKGAKVLEVGCASGFFLDRLRDDYTVYGNEWNGESAEFVRTKLGLPCSEDDLAQAFPGEQFTAICAFQVIEHIADPMAWVQLAKSRLIGGGWLILDTPNLNNALLDIYQVPEFAEFFYRVPHLQYFTRMSLAKLLDANGFEGRVQQRQRYSLVNHLWWMTHRKPMENAKVAMGAYLPAPLDHPAQNIVNRFFARIDQEYRGEMDKLTACDTLTSVSRKREI